MESDDHIYTKEELKLISQKMKKIATKSNFYKAKYGSYDSASSISTKKIDSLLSLQQEPFYDEYVQNGKKYIEIEQQFDEKHEYLEPIYNENKELINSCRLQELDEKEIERNNPEIKSIASFIQRETKIKEELMKQYNTKILPCDTFKRLVDNLAEMKQQEEHVESFNEKFNIRSDIENNLNRRLKDDHLCLIEPKDTQNTVKEKAKVKECNFESPITDFTESFKEREKEKEKQQAWFKHHVSNNAIKGYYNQLKKMVDNDQVRMELKEGIMLNLQFTTTSALNDIDDAKKDYEQAKAEHTEYFNHRRDKDGTYSVRESERLSERQERLRKRVSELNYIINHFWLKEKNQYNMDAINWKAEEGTKETVDAFVSKNTEKMSPILHEREDCNHFDQKLTVKKGVIEGDITVECKNDADEFRVNNQLVFIPKGERKAHYRFPTTFHDIKKKGEFHKMYSEREMNTEFTK